MTADPLVLTDDVRQATDRLLITADGLGGEAAVAGPSRLPGWTRGHVLAHIARNADGMTNLMTWARTGVATQMYASPEARRAGIEAGAGRPLAEQVADIRDSTARFAQAVADMPLEAWSVQVPLPSGPQNAVRLVWRRLREVEVHHVDLAAGYTPADWPAAFAHRLLHEVCRDLTGLDLIVRATDLSHPLPLGAGGPTTVTGTAGALAAWLTGRSPGDDLTVEPAGPLPTPPDWI